MVNKSEKTGNRTMPSSTLYSSDTILLNEMNENQYRKQII